MPVQPTYPGVYIEEIPSGVRTITGVSTSIAAFIGYFKRGPMNQAVQIFNFGDFERAFGGLDINSEASYAIQQFFLNGGSQAYVVRVAAGTPLKSFFEVLNNNSGTLKLTAKVEGTWGNGVKVAIDHQTAATDLFNMAITEYDLLSGRVLQQEVFRNLSTKFNSPERNFFWDLLNDQNTGSKIIQIDDIRPTADIDLPNANGTISDEHASGTVNMSGPTFKMTVSVDGFNSNEIELIGLNPIDTLINIAPELARAINNIDSPNQLFSNATVTVNSNILEIVTGGLPNPNVQFKFSDTTAIDLKLDEGVADLSVGKVTKSATHNDPAQVALTAPIFKITLNVSKTYELELQGLVAGANDLITIARSLEDAIRSADLGDQTLANATVNVVKNRLQILAGGTNKDAEFTFSGGVNSDLKLDTVNKQAYTLAGGADGIVPDATALIGSLNSKTGMFALEDVDSFNILCIPRTGSMDDTDASPVLSAAIAYCNSKRAFLIIDTPKDIDDLAEIKNWMTATGNNLRDKNAALYYPRTLVADPMDNYRLRSIGASGTMAGLYARTDGTRGVWKAPAGTEANLRNVSGLTDVLSDRENGVLNPLGVNCLVNKPVYGNISWGARTLVGSDQMASEWKYVPVRRLTLYLEESLFRGLQWVVFEPNDEPLWAQIRLNAGAFMNNLFKQGAFQGTSPKDAYLVKCDRETTTQNDINSGIVNIVVGFAPLKPAEFVIIKIQQLAGQVQA